MNDTQTSNRIYITVDPSKVARCKWCGSAESGDWRPTKHGVYCSKQCKKAGLAGQELGAALCYQALAVLIAIVAFTPPYTESESPIPGVFVIEAFALGLYFSSRRGWHWRKEVPKNSRRNDAALDLGLLRGTATGVECPRCSANLDLNKIDSDMTYSCDYCGATGSVKLIKTRSR